MRANRGADLGKVRVLTWCWVGKKLVVECEEEEEEEEEMFAC